MHPITYNLHCDKKNPKNTKIKENIPPKIVMLLIFVFLIFEGITFRRKKKKQLLKF